MNRLALALTAAAVLTLGGLPAAAGGALSKSAAKKAVAAKASAVANELGADQSGARRCTRKSPRRVRCVGYLRFSDGSHCKWRQTARQSGSKIMVGELLQVRCFEGSGAGGVDGETEPESEPDPALDLPLTPEAPPPNALP